MPTSTDLMGFGAGPLLASLLGNDPQALTATGTTQATAASIRTTNVEVTTASSNTGVILPANAPVGTPFFVHCVSTSNLAVVYCPVGHALQAGTKATFSAAGTLIFMQSSVKKWQVTGTATASVA
jgi:hypothetical protein